MRYFYTLTFLFSFFFCFAQVPADYNGLYSVKGLPDDLIKSTFLKVDEDLVKEIKGNETRVTQRAKKVFVLNSNYFLDQFMCSGKIVFNDTISNYLNTVKNIILENDTELKQKIKVYVFKSPIVNALTTSQGVIFVTTGLLARLDNEAQLAYILCHEIIHYTRKHGINSYVEKINLYKNSRSFRKLNDDERFKLLASKSREHEMEADSMGLNLFLKTNYSRSAPIHGFAILKTSHLPVRNIPYDTLSLGVRIPASSFTKATIWTKTKGIGDTSNSYSTHPAIDERIASIKRNISDTTDLDKKKFIVSHTWFDLVHNISILETIRALIDLQDYGAALSYYHVYKDDFKNLNYMDRLRVRLFYEFYKSTFLKLFDIREEYGFIPDNMSEKELGFLALLVCRQELLKHPHDVYFMDIQKELINDLLHHIYFRFDAMESRFFYKMEIDLLNKDVLFKEMIKNANEHGNKNLIKSLPDIEYPYYRNKYLKKKRKEGIGLEKLVLVEPRWTTYRSNSGYHLVTNEKLTAQYQDIIKKNAKLTDVKIFPLSAKHLSSNSLPEFNDLILLKEYFDFYMSFPDEYAVFYDQEKVDSLLVKYETPYYGFSGVHTVLIRKSLVDILLRLEKAVLHLNLNSVRYLIKPRYYTIYYNLVFDLRTQEVVFYDDFYTNTKSKFWFINMKTFEYFKIYSKKNVKI